MQQDYIFTMHDVTKVINQKEILKNINLSYYVGAKIGVLGLNGAGKSTLLRIMAGVDKEFMGEAIPQKHNCNTIKKTANIQKLAYL